jgi:hypothetical protein
MSAGEVPLHQDGPHPPYVVWETNGLLPQTNVVEEGVFQPDVSGTTGDMSIGLTINTRATSVQSILQHVRRNISIAQPGV